MAPSEGVLVCAATAMEMAVFPQDAGETERLILGVGIPWALSTLYHCLGNRQREGRALPSLLLNIGIAGAYPSTTLAIGDIVLATGEEYGDVGFELPEPPGFRHVSAADFGGPFYDSNAFLMARPPEWRAGAFGSSPAIHEGRGCTVNTCTGTRAAGETRSAVFSASFETMEGAAVAQVGHEFGIPVCEIRAISNIAADRDMRPENIRLALENLRHYLNACPALTRIRV